MHDRFPRSSASLRHRQGHAKVRSTIHRRGRTSALASGALEAAQRIQRGIPHCLDRLDPVAMTVLRGATAVFAPLFPPEAVVPANREFVSEPMPAQWRKGVGNLEFFIKRGSEGIRKWITEPQNPPEKTEQVHIQLFQTPAQGLARVEIRSHEWDELRRAASKTS